MRQIYFLIFMSVAGNYACSNKINDVAPANIQIFAPTAFTPNGDGVNDTFQVKTSSKLTYYHVAVYDAKNITVYQGNNIQKGWDGSYEDSPEPTGSYLWVINYQAEGSKVGQMSGSVELIR